MNDPMHHSAGGLDPAVHAHRRQRLSSAMHGGVAIVPTAPERARNRDTHYPYRFDSYFHYLTGFTEPESLVVVISGENPRSILFCREKNEEKEIWEGFRHGPDAARERFGFDEAWPIGLLDEKMPGLLADQPALWYLPGAESTWDARVMGWLNTVRDGARTGISTPAKIGDLRSILDEMRLFKDDAELRSMRAAAGISAAAHRRAMQSARPGMREFEIEAELLYEFRKSGAQFPAYTPIVASGANACVLHYVSNDAVMADGALLLIDAGCELDGYAADITRTFPVNGRFSAAQKEIYELVLAAQRAAIDATRPGAGWNQPHDAAVRVLAQGMIDLGLLSGTLDAVLEQEAYRRFYMHRTGHWLGLDVHDAGDYKRAGNWRPLEPGMTLTVEPGLYVRPGEGVPERYWNIGVRIEDDALVTPVGCEIITHAAPKSVTDIEALMRDGR
jgi:Xaa-Pro aminopeptidase